MKKTLWVLLVLSALSIGLYPGIYFVVDRKFGLLSTKTEALLANTAWTLGFYVHILAGGLALLLGWSQFSSRLRNHSPSLHRSIGKIYVAAAVLSGIAGFLIAFSATGGRVAIGGFATLATVWLYTTLTAFQHIRRGRVRAHERMMTYSYAACFAAVTLRIWLPMLVAAFQDFEAAYRVVAWLCWVPNVLVVRFFYPQMTATRSGGR
jgi:uncharacterized membrane protein